MDNHKSISILNELIIINNDRVEGYKTAYIEAEETDLKILLEGFQETSEKNIVALSGAVRHLGGEVEEGTRATGKFFRFWMDFKATLTGNNRGTILDSCEFGEDKALEAYETALDDKEALAPDHIGLILAQQAAIRADHDKVKALRDEAME
ncbi:PA2169 family four-helix-bundle protein [Flavobacterium antarcticum]|uniref:ferritin-like domain-containing protein n=1 Tax=Flavobacterium antarcticum TaxID=271155 RepID=UPI0003B51F3C|nr:PA2169 family four-helix-bundle protein [Flavobacterium antarcticum]